MKLGRRLSRWKFIKREETRRRGDRRGFLFRVLSRRPPFQSSGKIPLNIWIGGLISALFLLTALFAPLIAPYPPDRVAGEDRFISPSLEHPFGTDDLGRDLFSRVVHGARIALVTTALSAGISFLIGVSLGLVSGYSGGVLDQALSRLVDIWLATPTMLLALMIVARLGPSLQTTVLALGFAGIPSFFRLARGEAFSTREKAYVDAARVAGAGDLGVILHHILPNVSSSLIVLGTMRLGSMLLAVGGLSFLGLGAQPPQPEWGVLLAEGRDFFTLAPWLAVFPGLSITISVIGINLLGDGLRDLLDPQD